MKYCIVVVDGIADYPHIRTKNMTPLEVARTPVIDTLASQGRLGLVKTIPENFPCNAFVAIMGLLGFDPLMYHTGSAAFEAIARGIDIAPDDWIFSCDLISTFENTVADPRAGQIRTAEAEVLLADLNEHFADHPIKFHLGRSHHHLLTIHNTPIEVSATKDPFNLVGKPIDANYPQGEGRELLMDIMVRAKKFLDEHDINNVRRELHENPADAIWLWGGGRIPSLPAFTELFNLQTTVLSPYPEIQGFATAIGTKVIRTQVTDLLHPNYDFELEQTCMAWDNCDLVCLHLGTVMEVSRYGQISQKVRVLEQMDEKVIKPLQQKLPEQGRLMIVGGHFLSVQDKIGSDSPVPFTIYGKNLVGASGLTFNEKNAHKVNLTISAGHELLPFFLKL